MTVPSAGAESTLVTLGHHRMFWDTKDERGEPPNERVAFPDHVKCWQENKMGGEPGLYDPLQAKLQMSVVWGRMQTLVEW